MEPEREVGNARTCCCSLRTASIILAVIFIIQSGAVAALSSLFINEVQISPDREYNVWMTILIITLLTALIQLVLAVFLLVGSCKRKVIFIKAWYLCTWMIFGLGVVGLIFELFLVRGPGTTSVLPLMFYAYALSVVNRFMKELRGENGDEFPQPALGKGDKETSAARA